jgi:hypothetical protein
VAPEGFADRAALQAWVRRGATFAESLPPKAWALPDPSALTAAKSGNTVATSTSSRIVQIVREIQR